MLSCYRVISFAVLFAASLSFLWGSAAAEGPSAGKLAAAVEPARFFTLRVRPILVAKCVACHGGDSEEIQGDLDLTSRAGLIRGGESHGPAFDARHPKDSPLLRAVTWQDDELQMPPKENDRLSADQVETIRQWVAAGVPWPDEAEQARIKRESWNEADAEGVQVQTSGGLTDDWTDRRYDPADLWAFRPLGDPQPPKGVGGDVDNPIDAFLDRRLREAGLAPAPPADKRTLLRRITYGLTGLPPAPEETRAFLADDSPDAYRKLMERLLESRAYGEQWARHWLDVVRYADTAGLANDFARSNAWRYRDYVIRSFNQDKPYDEFVREQLAGDEMVDARRRGEASPGPLTDDDVEKLIAAGFLRMGPWEHTAMSVAAVTRQSYLDDVVNSVGETFLAQPLRCAKCHDHKFDPIPTRDFYSMHAVFATTQLADRDAPYLPVENTAGFDEGRRRVQRLKEIDGVRSLATLPRTEWPVAEFDADTEKKGHAKVNRKRKAYLDRMEKRYMPLALSVYSGPPRTFNSNQAFVKMPPPAQLAGKPPTVHILTGGAVDAPGENVTPGWLSAIPVSAGPAVPDADALHGRRLALAARLTHPDHPLTARVMVNRIWQYHFGRGLAANPNNFGATGAKPTHPELLDFLARRFIESGWSVKEMHRLILTSNAYRRSGLHPDPAAVAARDPHGELYAMFRPRRLTAEELRDSMLSASGELNRQFGGIPARPEINLEAAMQPRHIMGSVAMAYQPSLTRDRRNRRTIYALKIRTLPDPMLQVFNQPGPDASCERRDASTVPTQVYALFNSQQSYDRAIAMAESLERLSEDRERQVRRAFWLCFQRAPTAAETRDATDHLRRMTRLHEQHPPKPVAPPRYVVREMVEEMTGLKFYWVEDLDVYADPRFEPDLKARDVSPPTRALADLCLVLMNSNEFVYVY